jgi:hypothetical protein
VQRRTALTLTAAAVTYLSAGCVPVTYPRLPGVQARVLDAETGAPIANATATVYERDKPDFRSEATTSTDAAFAVSELSRTIWIPPVPFDWGISVDTLRVRISARCYESRDLEYYDFRRSIGDDGAYDPRRSIDALRPFLLKRSPTRAE